MPGCFPCWRGCQAVSYTGTHIWNRAVAVGFAAGPAAGLAALEPLESEPQLTTYGFLASARADLLRRLGRIPEALASYEQALALTENEVERSFLAQRVAGLKSPG